MNSPTIFASGLRNTILSLLVCCCLFAASRVEAKSDLSSSQARKLISKMAGLELPSGSIRIKSVSEAGAGSADVVAEIKTVFRFEKDSTAEWRVREVRIGQDRWLPISLISNALHTKIPVDDCSVPDPPVRRGSATDPSVKRSRCLLASLFGVTLPSDLVRIQEVSPFIIPVASQPSAIVTALLTFNLRATRDSKSWRMDSVRAGSSEWIKLENLAASIDLERKEQARGEMAWMAEALEQFRKDRGFYIVSDSQGVVMDHLSPKYLPRVIRVDPWQRAYRYQGERERFVLRSVGADGKEGTGDDIELAGPSR